MSDLQDTNQKIEGELFDLMASAPTPEAKEAAGKAYGTIQENKIQQAIQDLEKGSGGFLALINDLTAVVDKIAPHGDQGASLKSLRDQLVGQLQLETKKFWETVRDAQDALN